MAAKANVVIGEAPESDSDDELNVCDGIAVTSLSVAKGQVIKGEAPESDDETIGKSNSIDSISSAMSASTLSPSLSTNKNEKKEVSLLAKKLCERNASLAKNISDLATHTVFSANNELNSVDQHLLKCQVQVQEAANLLKSLNSNVSSLEQKLRIMLSSNYIPDITIPEQPAEMHV